MAPDQVEKAGSTIKLPPCPKSPNCVSSQAPDRAHAIRPFEYTGSAANARRALLAALASMPRTRIVSKSGAYIRAEFRTSFFKFVDVGEFIIRAHAPIIDVRSASQTGYYDFGVNRRRLEELRQRFDERMKRVGR